jgi:hypothetical protein
MAPFVLPLSRYPFDSVFGQNLVSTESNSIEELAGQTNRPMVNRKIGRWKEK